VTDKEEKKEEAIDDSGKCSSCKKNPADTEHPCPYEEELAENGDCGSTCNCCPDCTADCIMDI
jgi:hypothetical protein